MKNSFRSFLNNISRFTGIPSGGKKEHIAPPAVYLSVGSARSVGKVRKNNQDALYTCAARISHNQFDQQIGLFIVADGMGGHAKGEIASQLAIEATSNLIMGTIKAPNFSSKTEDDILEMIRTSIIKSQEVIVSQEVDMGTTLTLALVIGNNAYIANVGDSRCYIRSKEGLKLITNDHSLVNRLVEIGQITEEEAKNHPQKNVLYKALGIAGNITPDIFTRQLEDNDTLLLCSDGLWGCVEDPMLDSVLMDETDLNAKADKLIDLAMDAGGPDNISCVLATLRGR